VLSVVDAVQLAEQGIAIFFGPIGEVDDEVFDLLARCVPQGLGAAKIHGVGLHQRRIESMLANNLAEAITNPRAIPIAAVPVCRMWRKNGSRG
jgi:hypothetical protein